jgi:hypothetical protein
MATESVPDPAVVDSVELSDPAPDPGDCVPPCEEPRSVADLSPGWIALTDRELLVTTPTGSRRSAGRCGRTSPA